MKITKGFKSLSDYFEVAVINSEDFQARVKTLRYKYDIPASGHVFDPKIPGLVGDLSWNEKKRSGWLINIQKIRDRYSLGDMYWDFILADYIFYDKLDLQEHSHLYNYDLCKIDDLLLNPVDCNKNIEKVENKHFPIVIRVSPYASINHIQDFITKNQLLIKNLQKRHKIPGVPLGLIKGGKKALLNSRVMAMMREGLPSKEIADKIGGITYSEVNKIKYINKKRRKKV